MSSPRCRSGAADIAEAGDRWYTAEYRSLFTRKRSR